MLEIGNANKISLGISERKRPVGGLKGRMGDVKY